MNESDIETVEFNVNFTVRTTPERFVRFMDLLRNEVAIEPVEGEIIDTEGNRMLFELNEPAFNPEIVTLEEAKHFQKRMISDQTPNAVSTKSFYKVIRGLPGEAIIKADKEEAVAAYWEPFLERCERIFSGQDHDVSGPKTLGFLRGFVGHRIERIEALKQAEAE